MQQLSLPLFILVIGYCDRPGQSIYKHVFILCIIERLMQKNKKHIYYIINYVNNMTVPNVIAQIFFIFCCLPVV